MDISGDLRIAIVLMLVSYAAMVRKSYEICGKKQPYFKIQVLLNPTLKKFPFLDIQVILIIFILIRKIIRKIYFSCFAKNQTMIERVVFNNLPNQICPSCSHMNNSDPIKFRSERSEEKLGS